MKSYHIPDKNAIADQRFKPQPMPPPKLTPGVNSNVLDRIVCGGMIAGVDNSIGSMIL